MKHALTRAMPQSVDSATATETVTVPSSSADLTAALVRGMTLQVLELEDLPEQTPDDMASWLAQVRTILVDRGLMSGLPERAGALDRWRQQAACPTGCTADHPPVEQMAGEGFHHDFHDSATSMDLTESGIVAGGTITILPTIWVPPLEVYTSAGLADWPEPVAHVEIQDESHTLLALRLPEVDELCRRLHEGRRLVGLASP